MTYMQVRLSNLFFLPKVLSAYIFDQTNIHLLYLIWVILTVFLYFRHSFNYLIIWLRNKCVAQKILKIMIISTHKILIKRYAYKLIKLQFYHSNFYDLETLSIYVYSYILAFSTLQLKKIGHSSSYANFCNKNANRNKRFHI